MSKKNEYDILGLVILVGVAIAIYQLLFGMSSNKNFNDTIESYGGVLSETGLPSEWEASVAAGRSIGGHPKSVGGNITTLMDTGWSAFTVNTPPDYDWLVRPPSEISI